ncbi:hypothetical protein [Candidatus Ulvibacter alkanivorans]|uniref:hypothetical protein n=1 Tax=Candidatus Ulvibacter alkanivorans TaxID=2267620 RepID=UPI000DF15AD6|nr:hypothetical protein [Candidatus Ulvibacter alkanivorans]
MKESERIEVSNGGDHWECLCGNHTMASGFGTCDGNGASVEPFEGIWEGLYACHDCGRVIDQENYTVISKAENVRSLGATPSQ